MIDLCVCILYSVTLKNLILGVVFSFFVEWLVFSTKTVMLSANSEWLCFLFSNLHVLSFCSREHNNTLEVLRIVATAGGQTLCIAFWLVRASISFFTTLREKAVFMKSLEWRKNDVYFSHICKGRFPTPSERNATMSTGSPWLWCRNTFPSPGLGVDLRVLGSIQISVQGQD